MVGVSCWFLLKGREKRFALKSIKVASWVGLIAALLSAYTGDGSGYEVAQKQPMKLAAMEGYYEGEHGAGLVAFGILNPDKKQAADSVDAFLMRIEIPRMLSLLAERDADAFVPGINDLLQGGYMRQDGSMALSTEEKMARGRQAIAAFAHYREAMKAMREAQSKGDEAQAEAARDTAEQQRAVLSEHMPYFGYGYVKDANQLVPNVPLTFYMFRVMVMLGGYFIFFFMVVLFVAYRKDMSRMKWLHWIAMFTIPLGYLAGQAGWVVAECGRQPWAIQDMLPVDAAVSRLDVGAVQTTFFIFLALFTVLLIAEVSIMLKAIQKGPEKP